MKNPIMSMAFGENPNEMMITLTPEFFGAKEFEVYPDNNPEGYLEHRDNVFVLGNLFDSLKRLFPPFFKIKHVEGLLKDSVTITINVDEYIRNSLVSYDLPSDILVSSDDPIDLNQVRAGIESINSYRSFDGLITISLAALTIRNNVNSGLFSTDEKMVEVGLNYLKDRIKEHVTSRDEMYMSNYKSSMSQFKQGGQLNECNGEPEGN